MVLLAAAGAAQVAGQEAAPAPVFTAEQAAAGKAAYARTCAACHAPDLSGNNDAPLTEAEYAALDHLAQRVVSVAEKLQD